MIGLADLISKSCFTAAGRGQLSTHCGHSKGTYFADELGGRVEPRRRGVAAASCQNHCAEVLVRRGGRDESAIISVSTVTRLSPSEIIPKHGGPSVPRVWAAGSLDSRR